MKRYIDGIYAQKRPEGAMLGYVRQTKCSEVVKKLLARIIALEGSPNLDKTSLLLPFEEHYFSKHKRVEGISPFTIHHLLFLFAQ